MARRGDLYEALHRHLAVRPGEEPVQTHPAERARPLPVRPASATRPADPAATPRPGGSYDLIALVTILVVLAAAVSYGVARYLARDDGTPTEGGPAAPGTPRTPESPTVRQPTPPVPPLPPLVQSTGPWRIGLITYGKRQRAMAQTCIDDLVKMGFTRANFSIVETGRHLQLCYGGWPRDPQKANDRAAMELLAQFRALRLRSDRPFQGARFQSIGE